MAVTYKSVLKVAHVGSGLADIALWAPLTSFDTNGVQVPNAFGVATTNAELVSILSDHVFLLDHGFIKLQAASGKVSLEAKLVGDPGSKKVMQQAKVFIAGSDPDLHAQIMLMMNQPSVWLFKDPDCNDPQYYQLGSECVGATLVDGTFSTGTTRDGVKGWEFTVEFPSPSLWIYKGALTFPTLDSGNPYI